MESGKGNVGGEHGHLWPQHGEFLTNVDGKTMVRFSGIISPKQGARCVSPGVGNTSGA